MTTVRPYPIIDPIIPVQTPTVVVPEEKKEEVESSLFNKFFWFVVFMSIWTVIDYLSFRGMIRWGITADSFVPFFLKTWINNVCGGLIGIGLYVVGGNTPGEYRKAALTVKARKQRRAKQQRKWRQKRREKKNLEIMMTNEKVEEKKRRRARARSSKSFWLSD